MFMAGVDGNVAGKMKKFSKARFYTWQGSHAKAIDRAMVGQGPGGIDLNAVDNILQTQNEGEGIKFHLDPAMLAQLQNAPGFVPVIIGIEPLVDLRQFLGIH